MCQHTRLRDAKRALGTQRPLFVPEPSIVQYHRETLPSSFVLDATPATAASCCLDLLFGPFLGVRVIAQRFGVSVPTVQKISRPFEASAAA